MVAPASDSVVECPHPAFIPGVLLNEATPPSKRFPFEFQPAHQAPHRWLQHLIAGDRAIKPPHHAYRVGINIQSVKLYVLALLRRV